MSFPVVNGVEVLVAPPEDYHVNFTHPFKDTATINSSYWAFGVEFFVAFLFLSQRIYTASFILRKWRSDDYMIVMAWVLTTVAQCLILHCLTQGVLGVHIWEMSLDDAIWETTLIHATTLTVIPGTVLAKLVLCIFYYRLSPITLGAAVARLVILIPSLKNSDTTFVLAQGTLWLIVEANLIIICGSLPTFRIFFFNHISPKILSEANSRDTGNKGPGSGGMRYALRTFGSSQPKRRHFDTIDELELGDRPDGAGVRWKTEASAVGGGPTRKKSLSGASDEEAIIKTTETSVTHAPRRSPEGFA